MSALTRKLLQSDATELTSADEDNKTETENDNFSQQPQEITNNVENSKKAEKMQQVLIKDETVNTTTNLVISSLAFLNGTLLYSTLENTTHVEGWSDLSNSWLIFSISLTLAIIIIMIPLCCWIDVQSDKFKTQFLTEDNNDAQNEQDIDDKRPFFTKFEFLVQAAISFVVSMTLRDAAKLTFQQKVIERNNMESAAYILYALIWTIIGVWITIHLTNRYCKYKNDIIEQGVLEIDSRILTHFAVKQRYISLMLLTTTYIMAWSWRTAIDTFVLSMYGGDKLTTAHVWIYCIIVTITMAFLVSLSDHFYCLYPKEISGQNLFTKSRTVEETNKLIYNNVKFVVGFAWHAALRVTVFYNATKSIAFNALVLYWFVAITMVFISIYATHKLTQQRVQRKIDAIGLEKLVESVVTVSICNSDENIELSYTQYTVPKLCNTFGITIISLTAECWAISGSLFIGDAVSYSILATYYSINEYRIDLEYGHVTTGLWLQWTVVVVTLAITALIMLYLRKSMRLFSRKKKDMS